MALNTEVTDTRKRLRSFRGHEINGVIQGISLGVDGLSDELQEGIGQSDLDGSLRRALPRICRHCPAQR